MTMEELRAHPEYRKCLEKIRGYRKGFEFTIPYYKMTRGQQNAMRIVLDDAEKAGLIESVRIGLGFVRSYMETTEETYRRV